MNILIDIGHPAHVHLFRNFYQVMKERGHKVYVTVKELPSATNLLEFYKIPFIMVGRKGQTLTGKAVKQTLFSLKLAAISKRYNIDIGIGSSISLAHASRLCRMKSIIFDDDDDIVQPLMVRYGHPFADLIVSPSSLVDTRASSKALFYSGFHELAYLHPTRFTPDKSVLMQSDLKPGDPFFVMRFNAFRAHHDKGARGLSTEQKLSLIKVLEPHGKVLITTEEEIEKELHSYQMKTSPEMIHSLLSFAKIFIGDSQTMTSEAAVLGAPALRCNSFAGSIAYLRELEETYGLTYAYKPEEFDQLLERIKSLINMTDLKSVWEEKRKKMLQDKIDVTQFMVWLVEEFFKTRKIEILREKYFKYYR